MRLFFVSRRVPFPPDRGDKIAVYNQIRHLAQAHEVHVFCLADGQEDIANVAGLQDCAASVTAVPVSPVHGRLRAFRALLGTEPLSVAMLHEAKLHGLIRRGVAELRPDLIIVYSSNMAQFAEPFAHIARIMQFADLDSRKWRDYAVRTAPPMRWVYALEARRLLEYERRIAREFSYSLVCTVAEAEDFHALIPDRSVTIVRNGVDLAYFRAAGVAKRPGSLVFTGVMNYAPNVDAVRWFCADIMPLIRKDVPEVTLTICGSRPTRSVRRLAEVPGVSVTGPVPDVRPYLDQAEVFVAPLRLARGIQNKVLEAMAMGLPVVASCAAWRPTEIPQGEGIVGADAPGDFAAHIVRLLRDLRYREVMGQRARDTVERSYGWAAQLAALDCVIAKLAATRSCPDAPGR